MIRWLRKKLTPTSIHPILAEIDRRNLQLSCYRFVFSGEYELDISTQSDGVTCKVAGKGPTFDAALADAWRKWP